MSHFQISGSRKRSAFAAAFTSFAVATLGMASAQAAPVVTPDCSVDAGTICRVIFDDANSVQNWQVPGWVRTINMTIAGGVGGPSGSDLPASSSVIEPFYSLYATGDLTVDPNSTIQIGIGAGGTVDAGGQNPQGDYSGGDAIAGIVGGGGAATTVDVSGTRYVVAGTAGASRRFLSHIASAFGTQGAAATGVTVGSVTNYSGGGGGGYVGGAPGRPGSSYLGQFARYSGMQYAESGSNGTVTIEYAAPEPATAPIITSVTPSNETLTLGFVVSGQWAGPDADNYEYSLDLGTTWTAVSPAQTSSPLTISGLTNGVNYPVQIRAVNAAGKGQSSLTEAGVPFTTPDAPSMTPRAVADGVVQIDVVSPVSNGGSQITNYEYSTDGGSSWIAPSPADTSGSLSINGLTVGHLYSVGVRAVNAAGAGSASVFSDVTPIAGASAPSISLVTPGDGVLSVDFVAPSSDGASAITNYQYSVDGGATWTTRSPASTASPIVISGLSNGSSYGVQLRAVNGGGDGVASASSAGIPRTIPSAAGISSISSTSGKLYVSVTAPSSNGGSAVTNYEYSTDGGSSWTAVSPAQTSGIITIDGLTVGTTYAVKVRAVNVAGAGTASVAVDGKPITVADAPTVTGVTAGSGQVSVAFTAPSSDGASAVTNYEYTVNGGLSWTAVSPAASSSPVVITGLANGTTYSVGLRAVNRSGRGAASTFTSATPFTTAGVPTVTGVTAGNVQATVSFTAPASNGGSDITGFEYSSDSGQNWVSAGLTSPVVVTGLTNGSGYVIKVRAVNAAGAGNAASSSTVTPRTVPDAPSISALTSTNGVVHAVVDNPAFNGGAAITNFEYSVDNGDNWTALSPAISAGLSSTSFDITGLTVGHLYSVGVRAVNAAGAGSASVFSDVTPITGASAPVIDSISVGHQQITIHFTEPTDDGGAAISNYQYSVNGGSTWITVAPAQTAGSIVVNGLINGTTYLVKLRAVTAGGTAVASASVSAVPRTVAGAPVVTGVTSLDGELRFDVTAPVSNGGNAIVGYEWTIDNGLNWTSVSTVSGGVTVRNLTNGDSYSFMIRASNDAGVGEVSNTVVGIPATTPSAPTFSSVLGSNGKLTFELDSSIEDGGSAVTGVQYRTVPGGGWITPSFSGIDGTYVVSGLTNGTSYSLQVRLVNRIGAGFEVTRSVSPTAEVPSAPALGDVTVDNGKLRIVVTPATDDGGSIVTGYKYSIDGGAHWVATSLVDGAFAISGLTNGTSYSVILEAVNAVGNSVASNVVSATPLATAPAAIMITSLVSVDHGFLVNFVTPESDGGSLITGYEYSIDAGVTWQTATVTAERPVRLSIDGLTNGYNYLVKVRARNAVGVGPDSSLMAGLVGTTSGHLVLTAASGAVSSADATFAMPSFAKYGAWANQWYQYSLDGGVTWSRAVRSTINASLKAAGKAYIHIPLLVNGRTYPVAVRAMYTQKIDGLLMSAPGQSSISMNVTPRTVASAPRITTISTTGRAIIIHFEAPSSNGGAAITSYAYSFGGSKWIALSPATPNSPITISGLDAGRTYTVRLRAINPAGQGAASGISAIVVKR
jgi:titin